MRRLLVANRAEVAVRILRGAADLGLQTVAVHSAEDARALHTLRATQTRELHGTGVAAYLDAEQIVGVAKDTGCDAIHPGYGFLAEDAAFADLCRREDIVFVGPRPEVLEVCANKVAARELAAGCGVPVLPGTAALQSADDAAAFLERHGPVMVKAVAGGGGRGMRAVRDPADLEEAIGRASAEAAQAFGDGAVYLEQLMQGARHVEVQVLGDGSGAVRHLWERDCSLQRRHQKLVEVAPAPGLPGKIRDQLLAWAVQMAGRVRLDNACTFEFLVRGTEVAFIEANPRLQVEHTVTEEITGVDLVRTQLLLAGGRGLEDLALPGEDPRGVAVQVRVNAETVDSDGSVRPASGTITAFEPPSGPGVRVDTAGYPGLVVGPSFDSLLAKVITRGRTLPEAAGRAYRALCEFHVDGVRTNIGFLQGLLERPEVHEARWHTGFVDDHAAVLRTDAHPRLFVSEPGSSGFAGAKVDPRDPLAVLHYGKAASGPVAPVAQSPEGTITAPLQGTVVSIDVAVGDVVRPGQQVCVMEAMKMQHVVSADTGGVVQRIGVGTGDTVHEGHPLMVIEPAEIHSEAAVAAEPTDLDEIRPDLSEVLEMHRRTLDETRPKAVQRRRATGQRTARENIDDLCDPGSFVEYGPLVIASPWERKPLGELIERTATDGFVSGIGRVNGESFGPQRSRCAVAAYDYTVLAGTQGGQNHRKKDRIFEVAEQLRLPVVLFTEGGGGRAAGGRAAGGRAQSSGGGSSGEPAAFAGGTSVLDPMAFHLFAKLSGLVPLVGINSGWCFAGNAALLGCCDVVIATQNSSIGMGGPAMIEGGGLGVYAPQEVGPMHVQVPNGVVDVAVDDEAQAVRIAKQYLSYFQGSLSDWECADQRLLRRTIPENRLRVYDVRTVIDTLADTGSVLELRRGFGLGMVTALARVEGRAIGIVANNPAHLAGAIDSPAADKASRFMQLCDAFDLPILFLCDTPGIMVGPQAETTGIVRHAARMFVTGASLSVPFFTIVLRKAYGLGAMAMAGGSYKVPAFAVSWPTGEFGGMGLEGQVKLGARDLLASVDDPGQRQALYERMVDRLYEFGRALNTAVAFGIDDVIDPSDSRRWITAGLESQPDPAPRRDRKRPFIDTW